MRRPICRRHCTAYIPAQRDQARGLSYKQKSNWPVPTSDSPFKADIRQFGWIVRYVPILLQKLAVTDGCRSAIRQGDRL
jgi:hypothetical protein